MKLRLSTSLRVALLALLSFSAVPAFSAAYMAEGVAYGKDAVSTRFYDSGKGHYWASYTSGGKLMQPLAGVYERATQEQGYGFLGELQTYVPDYRPGSMPGYSPSFTVDASGTVGVDSNTYDTVQTVMSDFASLRDDKNMCWAYASSNAIQYWMSYYGVFSKSDKTLPYGYTYAAKYQSDLGGTQSLRVNMAFYDNWVNTGCEAPVAFSWWLSGDGYSTGRQYGGGPNNLLLRGKPDERGLEQTGKAGFFDDYYPAYEWTPQGEDSYMLSKRGVEAFIEESVTGRTSLGRLADSLSSGLGYEKQADDSYALVDKGQLVIASVQSETKGGHAVTVHGFETDADGGLKCLYATNSDDGKYELFKLYVRLESNQYYLYTNEACTEQWIYSSSPWYLQAFTWINTTDELKAMRELYDSNELVWRGVGGERDNIWLNNAESAISEALPTGVANWQVEVTEGDGDGGLISADHEGYYDSYFGNGRNVLFDDSAASSDVILGENIEAGSVTIDNSEMTYAFSGADGAQKSLQAVALGKMGAGDASFVHVAVKAQTVDVSESGSLRWGEGASLVLGTAGQDGFKAKVTMQRALASKGDAILSHAKAGVEGAKAYIRAESASARAVVSNFAITVEEGNLLEIDSALLTNGTTLSGGSGASLTATDVTLELGSLSRAGDVSLTLGSSLLSLGGEAALVLDEQAMVLALQSDALKGLSVSGDSFTLDFSTAMVGEGAEAMAVSSLFSRYEFVSITFDTTTFSGLDTFVVEGLSGAERLSAYYLQEQGNSRSAAGTASTLYFAVGGSSQAIPEPATATLSLLALAALAARRRRR